MKQELKLAILTHSLSLKECLLTGTNTMSPAGLATPPPGLANSTRPLGEKISAPSLKANSCCNMCVVGMVSGTWEADAAENNDEMNTSFHHILVSYGRVTRANRVMRFA
jgi:hypothetical protein